MGFHDVFFSRHIMSTSRHSSPPNGVPKRSSWPAPTVLSLAAAAGYLLAVATTPAPTQRVAPRGSPTPVASSVPPASLADPGSTRSTTQRNVSSLRAIDSSLEHTLTGSDLVSGERTVPTSVPKPDPSMASVPPPLSSDAAMSCPYGMVLVEGEYCPAVSHRCLDYLSVERDRCAEYAEGHQCFGTPVPMRFCIDQFEYPNVRGVKPDVAVTYREAEAKCEAQGKRLCTAREWTLACEGPERLPYPTGRLRDENACNYDRAYRFPNNDRYANPRTRAAEIKRLDQSVASGELSECKSAYGVHDMTGNVDEWVYNETGSVNSRPYVSGLKGGYWGPVRNRCRPMTLDHNEWHSGYQIGFRCCATGQDQSPAIAQPGVEPRAEADPDVLAAISG